MESLVFDNNIWNHFTVYKQMSSGLFKIISKNTKEMVPSLDSDIDLSRDFFQEIC